MNVSLIRKVQMYLRPSCLSVLCYSFSLLYLPILSADICNFINHDAIKHCMHIINTSPLTSFYVFAQCVVQLHQTVVGRRDIFPKRQTVDG